MATIIIKNVLTDKILTIEYKVKVAILYNFGYKNPDPKTLDNQKAMADFAFNDPAYIVLTRYFNLITITLNNAALEMLPVDIEGLAVVQNCIDTVTAVVGGGTGK